MEKQSSEQTKKNKQTKKDSNLVVQHLQTYLTVVQRLKKDMLRKYDADLRAVGRTISIIEDERSIATLKKRRIKLHEKRRRLRERYNKDAQTLRLAIKAVQRYTDQVLPNQHRLKKTIVKAMAESPIPLNADELLYATSIEGLLLSRRRLQVRLAELKRIGVVTNPIKGYWTLKE
jgi:hypothetical protein